LIYSLVILLIIVAMAVVRESGVSRVDRSDRS